jgi:hypothetical protein
MRLPLRLAGLQERAGLTDERMKVVPIGPASPEIYKLG